jgi:putative DNA primase/helicase
MSGILNWAIEGWFKLHEIGKFAQPTASAAAIQKLEDMGSPITAFARDRCEVGAGYSIEKGKLYAAWLLWCDTNGYRSTTTDSVFGRDLYAAFPHLDKSRPTNPTTGGREEHYTGIQLRKGE